jgi:ubiquinol oxidase
MLDTIFDGRPLARLWFLETVARVPYFSYISMLHLYESIGWWRIGASVKRIHFAEEWNELHHLLIMEALGGDRKWIDRFMAGHSAIVYYWVLIVMWLISPTLAYNFSELIEAHAVDTYGQFVDENAELLKTLPAPLVARRYYTQDLYLYDEFQTARAQGSRRPVVETLYDVFSAIRDDEAEHVNTMNACQDPDVLVRSPNVEAALAATAAAAAVAETLLGSINQGGIAEDAAAALLSMAEEIIENGSSML